MWVKAFGTWLSREQISIPFLSFQDPRTLRSVRQPMFHFSSILPRSERTCAFIWLCSRTDARRFGASVTVLSEPLRFVQWGDGVDAKYTSGGMLGVPATLSGFDNY